MSERTTSDQDFARLFSPKILEKLADDAFVGAVHAFRSAPGAGKTTLLRAFTPAALSAFWSARRTPELAESIQKLTGRGVLDEKNGPQLLGVLLSCASGYADLPSGADTQDNGLFRALLDCRIILRALRSIATLVGISPSDGLKEIELSYQEAATDLKYIPRLSTGYELGEWAERREQLVYEQLDSLADNKRDCMPSHLRYEGILWLESVVFVHGGKELAPRRLLMIDDLHRLRKKQRALLIDELTVLRSRVPVWLAERTSALGDELLSQGARQGRDIREYSLEALWGGTKGAHQFKTFSLNILDRRMTLQDMVATGSFSQCLRGELNAGEVGDAIAQGISQFEANVERHRSSPRYQEWLSRADERTSAATLESLFEAYATEILISRDEAKRQMTLELALSEEELEARDSSQVRAAAELFVHEELDVPYFFGIERLCAMASSNIEELLSLASVLYEGLQAKQVLRNSELVLTPGEQEKLLLKAAKRKRDFIPRSHSQGRRAQRLLDSIGAFCRDKTFAPNAPYAPGVTGVRLSQGELASLEERTGSRHPSVEVLSSVLAECAAENLLLARRSAASGSRDSGTVFYLNRTLCAHYGLPLQMGGWQDVRVSELARWMERELTSAAKRRVERS